MIDGYDSAKVLTVFDIDSKEEWIIYSECSFHMCPTKSWFQNFTELDSDHVIIGNNKFCKILDIGTIRLKMFDGMKKTLQEIRYIPKPKRNLISLGMLDKIRYIINTKLWILKVTKGSMTVMKDIIKNGVYTLITKIVLGEVYAIQD